MFLRLDANFGVPPLVSFGRPLAALGRPLVALGRPLVALWSLGLHWRAFHINYIL